VLNVSVQRLCSVVKSNKNSGPLVNNDKLKTRQTNCCRDITFEPPPPPLPATETVYMQMNCEKWRPNQTREITRVPSQTQESLTRNFISEKWFWFTGKIEINMKLVIWWNKAPEIESVPVFWGTEVNAIVRFDKKNWMGGKELHFSGHWFTSPDVRPRRLDSVVTSV
jgi:hypothetical protein